MSSHPELPDDMKETIKNLNECLIKIAENSNLTNSLEKIDFLEKEGFYKDKPEYLFIDNQDDFLQNRVCFKVKSRFLIVRMYNKVFQTCHNLFSNIILPTFPLTLTNLIVSGLRTLPTGHDFSFSKYAKVFTKCLPKFG